MHSVFLLWCPGALLGNEMVKQENILCMFVFVFLFFIATRQRLLHRIWLGTRRLCGRAEGQMNPIWWVHSNEQRPRRFEKKKKGPKPHNIRFKTKQNIKNLQYRILCFGVWLLCQWPVGATEVSHQVNNLLITHTLVPVLSMGLRCSQVNFSCDKSHDRHGKMDGQPLPEWIWLILVSVNSQCSSPDICAWMRQLRQSKRGDEAALRLQINATKLSVFLD